MKLIEHGSQIGFLLLTTTRLVTANVEKIIFLGPSPTSIATGNPTISGLNLQTLTPGNSSLRRELSRVFPEPSGQPTWLLLDELTEGQRYEVRVCWSALEPTSFSLDIFELNKVWGTPELVQSLSDYLESLQPERFADDERLTYHIGEEMSSILLLRVLAAADYFTDNAELMKNPPPVLVDLILDPFFLNVLPRSLIPTVRYIVVVAILTFLAARWIATMLQVAATQTASGDKKK